MRSSLGILAVFALQLLLTFASVRSEMARGSSLSGVFFGGMFLLPFAGYIVVLYRAPMRFASSPPVRIAVLTLLSFFITLFGAIFCYIILASAGVPVRGEQPPKAALKIGTTPKLFRFAKATTQPKRRGCNRCVACAGTVGTGRHASAY